MKALGLAIAAANALCAFNPSGADAREWRDRSVYGKKHVRPHARPASVQRNGLCQRDTGTPNDKLDFRNWCDMEEFWNRIMERDNKR